LLLSPPFDGLDQQAASADDSPRLFFDPLIADASSLAGARLVGDMRVDNGAELARLLEVDPPPARRDSLLLIQAYSKWVV
jgi:hypothetical protein